LTVVGVVNKHWAGGTPQGELTALILRGGGRKRGEGKREGKGRGGARPHQIFWPIPPLSTSSTVDDFC